MLTGIIRAKGMCKSLVGHFTITGKKKKHWRKRELNLPEHGLITECRTWWGTKQQMMEKILEQQRALSQILSENRSTRHMVQSWQDTEVLESVSKALKPLQEFTDALSGEDYVSISYLLPVLHLLKTNTCCWRWWHRADTHNPNSAEHCHIYRPKVQKRLHL